MVEFEVKVPRHDNGGVLFLLSHFRDLKAVILDLFGGFSTTLGTVIGTWKDSDGEVYRDRYRVYQIGLSLVTQGPKILVLVAFILVHMRQKAVYVKCGGDAEVLMYEGVTAAMTAAKSLTLVCSSMPPSVPALCRRGPKIRRPQRRALRPVA